MIAGAIRTDLILSAEIMVIALNEVSDQPFVARAAILVVVALGITALVYGVVAAIVKMDDIGIRLTRTRSGLVQKVGHGMVRGMPGLLALIRSEEHTSELQSLMRHSYADFCLKKNKTT